MQRASNFSGETRRPSAISITGSPILTWTPNGISWTIPLPLSLRLTRSIKRDQAMKRQQLAEGKVTPWRQMTDSKIPAYATETEFCRIFDEDMNSLYWLSLLLTADEEKAEQCFVSGLGDCVEGNPVFGEWAHSWARRTIIQNAIRMIAPQPSGDRNSRPREMTTQNSGIVRAGVAAVLGLQPFERFVFIMSVLEHYSDQDCSALLNASRHDVTNARAKALGEIGQSRRFELENRSGVALGSMSREAAKPIMEQPVIAHLSRSA